MRALRLCLALTAALALTLAAAQAAPVRYSLEPAASTVGFETDFGGDLITGRMPVAAADLTLDFDNLAASRIEVVLDAAGAAASLPFAAQAMKGPKVLDTANFPTLHFASTSVRKAGDGAEVQGALTLRGVTRPMRMQAVIWRQTGQPEGDLSRLTIRLTGSLRRSDFAATGWSDMVGDEVRLDIRARIHRTE